MPTRLPNTPVARATTSGRGLPQFHSASATQALVSRPRLIRRLRDAVSRTLTLVSAPAGYGKTTAVALWAQQAQQPVAWLALEAQHDDPVSFWSAVILALQSCQPNVGQEALALLQTSRPPPTRTVLAALIDSLQTAAVDLTLVLDDCQAVRRPDIYAGLDDLLERTSAQLHLVLVGRVVPPLPLARWLARDQAVVLRADVLRFSLEEAQGYLRQVLGPDWPPGSFHELLGQAEGWITGLLLAANEIRGSDPARDQTTPFTTTPRAVREYLTTEVLAHLPASTRRFLLRTAMLDRLSAPLCDAVTGSRDGQSRLLALERANLFLEPLDPEQRWYRYHGWFAGLLRHLAEARLDLADLHRRAGAWLEHNQLISASISHALRARDFGRAARLIEPQAEVLMRQGELATLRAWLQALPGDLVQSRAGLCLWSAWLAALSHGSSAAEPYLTALENLQKDQAPDESRADDWECQSEQARRYAGQVAVIRSMLALGRDQWPEAVAQSRRALAMPEGQDLRLCSLVALNLGTTHLARGDIHAAQAELTEACRSSQTDHHPLITLSSLEQLTRLRVWQGRLPEAGQTCQTALALAAENDMARYAHWAHVNLGYLHYEQDELDAAWTQLQEGLRLADLADAPASQRAGYVLGARLGLARGDAAAADAFMARAQQAGLQSQAARQAGHLAAWQARLWIRQGRLERAADWAQHTSLTLDAAGNGEREFETVTWARLLLAQKEWHAARQVLERCQHAAQAAGRLGSALEALALRALAEYGAGHAAQAEAPLCEAISLAELGGYIRLFVDEGPAMHTLLARLRPPNGASSGALRTYLGRLLAHFPQAAVRGPGGGLPEPLTKGELQILHLMARGLTNRAIAQALVVAPSTVAWHLKNVYGKLAVHNRTQAIARARELNLLH